MKDFLQKPLTNSNSYDTIGVEGYSLIMKRHLDKFDKEADREGAAMLRIHNWLKNPESPSHGQRPVRLFDNLTCYRIEHLDNKSYKKFLRR